MADAKAQTLAVAARLADAETLLGTIARDAINGGMRNEAASVDRAIENLGELGHQLEELGFAMHQQLRVIRR